MSGLVSPTSGPAMRNGQPLRTMPCIVLGLFGLYAVEFGVVGILPVIIDRFGVTAGRAGLLVGMFALIVAICGPFLVLVSSRYNRKPVLVCALSGFTLCSLLSAYAPNFDTLLALRILPALLHPVFFAAAFSTATALFPRNRAAHATSLAMVGLTVGLVVGVPLMTWIAASLSYEASFLFCAASTAVPGLALLLLPPQGDSVPMSVGQQFAVLRKPALWLNIVATILLMGTMFSVYSYAAEYLRLRAGMSGEAISLMMVVFGIGGVSGNLIAGRLLGSNLVLTTLFYPVALAGTYVILVAYGSAAVLPMALIVLLWGGVHTSGLVVSQIWLTAAAPEAPEFATSLFVSSANAGVVLGTVTGGSLISRFGIAGAVWCGLIFAVLSFLVIAAKVTLFGSASQRRGTLVMR